jgi:hypothetical protein
MSEHLLRAIAARLERGEQSLIFLNRRGYAPVLACPACGWASRCTGCAANMVVHLSDRRLRCHHCGCDGAHSTSPARAAATRTSTPSAVARSAWRSSRGRTLFPKARILRADRDAAKRTREAVGKVLVEKIACWRGGYSGRHADDGVVRRRLPRPGAALRATDAGRRPQRPCRPARRSADPDRISRPSAVPGADRPRLRALRAKPARRTPHRRLSALQLPGHAARRGARDGAGAGLPRCRTHSGRSHRRRRHALRSGADAPAAPDDAGARPAAGRIPEPPGLAVFPDSVGWSSSTR